MYLFAYNRGTKRLHLESSGATIYVDSVTGICDLQLNAGSKRLNRDISLGEDPLAGSPSTRKGREFR